MFTDISVASGPSILRVEKLVFYHEGGRGNLDNMKRKTTDSYETLVTECTVFTSLKTAILKPIVVRII
jgi:hypothetical protein